MMKRKNPMVGMVKGMVIGGTGLMVGSAVVGSIGGMSSAPGMKAVEGGVQSGLGIASMAMPIMGGAMVMGSLNQIEQAAGINQQQQKKKKSILNDNFW